MPREVVGGNYESAVLGDRFGLSHPPTILARTSSVAPIVFTRLRNDVVSLGRSKAPQIENAYIFHVQLQPAAMDMWIDGKLWPATTTTTGATFLYDLRSSPVAEMHSSFDNVRFYISQTSLDELAYDQGIRRTAGLTTPRLCCHDRVMYGLANTLLDHVERANEHSVLFIDHIALAFFTHAISAYGNAAVPADVTPGGLAPWQLRRAIDFLSAHLSEDPGVADLARECGLSAGYFSRAFRRTTGLAPHQWLIRKRVERARQLLLGHGCGLADIALRCGFTDQSHFTRAFAKLEGMSPGKWRQRHLKSRR
jgi:AraC-like DNA-binding protein